MKNIDKELLEACESVEEYCNVIRERRRKELELKKQKAKERSPKKRKKRKKRRRNDKYPKCPKMSYEKFLQSVYWKKVRKIILKRDNHMCRICQSKDNLAVHHTTYKHHLDEMNHLDNLMTMCNGCHHEFHMTCEVA